MTAADFVFAFRRALNPGTGSDLGRTLTCIANGQQVLDGQADPSELGVTALDSKTLKIDLAYSYEDFPKLMASSAAMPVNEKFSPNLKDSMGWKPALPWATALIPSPPPTAGPMGNPFPYPGTACTPGSKSPFPPA